MITYNDNEWKLNAGTEEEKSVKAFSAKQATLAFCKGGMHQGCFVTYKGKAYAGNKDIAVPFSRYNELLRLLEKAQG